MYSHVKAVESLFDQLNQVTPTESIWLLALHQRAVKKKPGWKAEADSYVQGLVEAGAISVDVATTCRDKLEHCRDSSFGELYILVVIVIVAAAATTPWLVIVFGELWYAMLFIPAAYVAVRWNDKQLSLKRSNNLQQSRRERAIGIFFPTLYQLLVAWIFVVATVQMTQLWFIWRFDVERTIFLADPQGFPLLHKMAKEEYGIEVVLANARESFFSAIDFQTASPALMAIRAGHCRLTMHPEKVLHSYGSVGEVDSKLLVQGTMMHEFAHCLDLARDGPIFGQEAVGTRSLAPEDAREVNDIKSYLDAETHFKTRLWREAVADIFAVGYWKLTVPEAAGDLVATLRRMRPSEKGSIHATRCWIDHADQTSAPTSIAALFEWADRLRTSALCELPAPSS
ncbi:MAG: hypothetical protein ABI167_07735 [Nitrosospira sp.]